MALADWRAALAVVLVLGSGPAGASEARQIDRIYDIYLGGVRLAELAFEAELGPRAYRARARIATTPAISWLFTALVQAETRGRVARGGLDPQRFVSDSETSIRSRSIRLDYGPDGIPSAEIDPQVDAEDEPWRIDADSRQAGTRDPLSAALLALAPAAGEEPCGRKVEIFDGTRRYAVALGTAEPDGSEMRCTGRYLRIAGFDPKRMRDPELAFDLWFSRQPDGAMRLDRVLGETPRGIVAMKLRAQP